VLPSVSGENEQVNVLPNGFHRIRHYGLLASGTKTETLARARELIAAAKSAQTTQTQQAPDSAAATDKPAYPCPCCGGRMSIVETFERGATPRYRPPPPTAIRIDTS
jgi:formate dehydrogenase maturation protein FdhE